MGGRHIDTAHMYGNHRDVARAIKRSNVPRDEIWVTSKIHPNSANTVADVEKQVDKALAELGFEYLDLMLLHIPSANPKNGTRTDVELWKGLIKSRDQGKVKSIGVSNYGISHIQAIEKATGIRPAVNQFYYNPLASQDTRELVQWCKTHGVIVEAFGSVGGKTWRESGKGVKDIAKVEAAAVKHHTSGAQYLLRWALNQGLVVIPGSTIREHIWANLNVPEFETAEPLNL